MNNIQNISAALGTMAKIGPRNLKAYLEKPGPDFEEATPSEINSMVDELLSNDANHLPRILFTDLLRSWDNQINTEWTNETHRNTEARRRLIHILLKTDNDLQNRIDQLLPFYPLEEPLVIAKRHTEWFNPDSGKNYYWSAYVNYLKKCRKLDDEAILSLTNNTHAIIQCLANPESKTAYSSRGLVMGYVQSGKTSNFIGVTARAADAGYRLIIILAGTWNILRNQTQRRFDKELLGKELLTNDEFYQNHPGDWHEFLEHGFDPVDRGHFTWQRLTRPDIDFKRLKAAIDSLEQERVDKSQPLYHANNLHSLPVKLLIIKKHSQVMNNLVKDLYLLRTRITELPALIIDDESDQAGVRLKPEKSKKNKDIRQTKESKDEKEEKERNATNAAIVNLLRILPRGQYIGYTATPYANALVDPTDYEDIFPKDFIIPLDRPANYMGISDFFDPYTDFSDLDINDFSQPEIAFIRRINEPYGHDDEIMKKALGSYLLSGAIKLFRLQHDPNRHLNAYKHHTMLIHISSKKTIHTNIVERVVDLWNKCAFTTPKGITNLKNIWDEDYSKVIFIHGKKEKSIRNFEKLIPYIEKAYSKITNDVNFIKKLNSDTDADTAPDFSAGPVWNIFVGGNTLSRGYTLEGLTISYYRRVAENADTLMQMGRWFGFRPGYRDLVRVYLGVVEGRKGTTDLVSLFKEVCIMEERFREEIKRYVRRPDVSPITPMEIPPLISMSGNIKPTASNKMFNASIINMNFGGSSKMPTGIASKPAGMKDNLNVLKEFLTSSNKIGQKFLGGVQHDGKKINAKCNLFIVENKQLIKFLDTYNWIEEPDGVSRKNAEIQYMIKFLNEEKHGIDNWLVVAPQRQDSFGVPLELENIGMFSIKERHRSDSHNFKGFGEPMHRTIAKFIAGISNDSSPVLIKPNDETLFLSGQHSGVMLLYPVRESRDDMISIGFELTFPENNLAYDYQFTVRNSNKKDSVIIESEA